MELQTPPQILSPCSSGQRRSSDSTSPEFEFWMVRNPSFPQPNLLSADELFSDGVLLPLQLLHLQSTTDSAEPDPNPQLPYRDAEPEVSSSDVAEQAESLVSANSTFTASKRWRDIFKKNGDKKNTHTHSEANPDNKEKKREKKKHESNGLGAAAELNINIWPFSRSRSAGNGGNRPRTAWGSAGSAATRKVSSAPCSRSNSAGESKSRKWPSSPSRGGIHVGRNSPVWQVRRGANNGGSAFKTAEKTVKKEGGESRRKNPFASEAAAGGTKARVLNLNVPMCIGYRQQLSCRRDENSTIAVAAAAAARGCAAGGSGGQSGGGVSGEGVRGSNLFSIRNFFTKKVY